MNRILAINPTLKFDALAKLSVEELKDLAEAGAPAMPIGKDKALSIAAATRWSSSPAAWSTATRLTPPPARLSSRRQSRIAEPSLR